MYAGPVHKPLPTVLQGDDPAIEAELRAWAFSKPEIDYGFEDLYEFGPMRQDRREEEWSRMEDETDYIEQVIR